MKPSSGRWRMHAILCIVCAAASGAATAEDAVTTAGEVLVTATRTDKRVTETPSASFVVTNQEMLGRSLPALDTALGTLPGVFDRRGKGMMDTNGGIALRGVPDAKRTAILLDGVPLNDGYAGVVDWAGLAPDDFSQVEVVLGPSSTLYGTGAMGGVVNLIPHMPDGPEAKYRFSYGSAFDRDSAPADTWRGYLSLGTRTSHGLGLMASVGYTTTDGYPTDLNVQTLQPPAGITGAQRTRSTSGATRYLIGHKGDNTWWDGQIALRGFYDFGEGDQLRAAFLRSGYDYGYEDPETFLANASGSPVFAYSAGASNVREASFLAGAGRTLRDLYQATLEKRLGASRLKLTAAYSDRGENWFTTPGTAAATTFNGGPGTYAETPSTLIYLDGQLTLPLGVRNTLVLGLSWREDEAEVHEYSLSDWRNRRSRIAHTFAGGGQTRSVGVLAQDELRLTDAVTVYAGARWEQWKSSDGFSNQFGALGFPKNFDERTRSELSPRLGAVWRVSDAWSLRANYGTAFRAPNIFELYRTWTSAAGTVFVSNPELEPETIESIDAGFDARPWRGGMLRATAYHNKLEDLIYRRSLPGNVREFVNAGEARVRGVELELRQQFSPRWSGFASATWNDSEVKDNPAAPTSEGKQLTQLPEQLYSAGLEWRNDRVFVGAVGRYVSKRFSVDDNSDVVNGVYGSYDPYAVVDVKAAYRFSRQFTLAVGVDNMFDREYYAFYLTPGRTWFVEVSGSF